MAFSPSTCLGTTEGTGRCSCLEALQKKSRLSCSHGRTALCLRSVQGTCQAVSPDVGHLLTITQGLARQISSSLLGIQIDAVYHTALVFGGVEYLFGQGVQEALPGRTHHGAPMEIVSMGRTELPGEVIAEYLDSLKAIYTPESYDLFLHNCNNFTNDFSMFLVGKGIPSHITSLPQTVLNTPFGQMLKPQLDNAMRGVTQAPLPAQSVPRRSTLNGHGVNSEAGSNDHEEVPGVVYHPTKLKQLDELLASAKQTCAVIFFTSATCPPCKIVYPAYDELAASAGSKAVLIKVDVGEAYEIGARYQIRVTPTFISFLKGEKENEWQGANESQLRGNVNLLIQMAHPPHPHTLLRVPTLQRQYKTPVTYSKVPPMEKVVAKMGALGADPSVIALKDFNTTRAELGAVDAPLPALPSVSNFIIRCTESEAPETLFPLVDLFRLALIDPRVSGYFTQDTSPVLAIVNKVGDLGGSCPYQLRIVTLHMTCNLWTSHLFPKTLSRDNISAPVLQLVVSSLLDTAHTQVRVVAAQLAFNMAATNHQQRIANEADILSSEGQIELIASLLEAAKNEKESVDVQRGLFLAIGLIKYLAPVGGELDQVCDAVGAKGMIAEAQSSFKELKDLAKEVELVL